MAVCPDGARARIRAALVVAAATASIATPHRALAQSAPATRQACIDAHADGQAARNAGHLRDAHARFLVCAGVDCPGPLRADCGTWLTQVQADLPSVVFAARDGAGHELTDARVFLDGEAAAESIDGRAVLLDPGTHRVRFERAGSPPGESSILVRVGEHNRAVTATFGDPPRKPSYVGPAVLGGVGILGLAGFTFFGLQGKGQYADLETSCSPRCSPDDTSAARTSFVVADVSLVVGLLALGGAAAWLAVTHPWRAESERPTQIGLGFTPVRTSSYR